MYKHNEMLVIDNVMIEVGTRRQRIKFSSVRKNDFTILHTSPHTHRDTHTHVAYTYITGKTRGTEAQPWEVKLKCWW